ncbi:MAG TPA: hypothetical protein DEF43_09475 [Chloroflexus aurantiacus]|jgi:hypothetical protein|uniref:Peptidase MA-like domain-containing protein n=1 Tax=Chloroflexus aurantiacus (strain ATCC 29366 / DSM 635 / J-10-fl) TaxID=324602 RepID=A9WAA7_CHLAA|nr:MULTISPECIES: hypothetical protein [Chloroflexus]ABY34666.1 hypothetical protein Caur_1438 [Chloroflexus aurantiacus J-10-fl]RMG52690.1 MAG: hypothetical protein D6716_02980 [Chloroflexota bacterium]HBW67374.1 hypothetical protein [Chloroflexus aurantiacus]
MRRTGWFIILIALMLVACTNQPAPTPTATEAVPTAVPATSVPVSEPTPVTTELTPEVVAAGIQQALDSYIEAYNTNNIELLRSVVDQTNAPFRRLVEERFNTFQESSFAGSRFGRMRVLEVKPRDHGFWQAAIDDGGYRRDILFRQIEDGRWVMSEPTEEQLGEKIRIENEYFTLNTYEWAAEVNTIIEDMVVRARQQVIDTLGRTPENKFNVYLRPIFGITPPVNPNSLAWYSAGSRPRNDRIDIFAPFSYAFGFYDPNVGWEAELYSTIVHELTHWAYTRAFAQEYRITDWMSEGLAEYVANNPRRNAVSAAVRMGRIIPLVDPNGGVRPQDMDHMTTLEVDRGLAYGFAYSLVAYIVETQGGLDGFWRFAAAVRDTPGTGIEFYDKALQKAFGITYEEFDAGWRQWLLENY